MAPTDEIRMLCDSIQRGLGAAVSGGAPAWPILAELGVPALLVPEGLGGLGADAAGMAAVAELFGRNLAISPFTASSVVATTLLIDTGNDEDATLLAGLAEGSRTAVLAHLEGDGRDPGPTNVGTRAERVDGEWRVTGRKALVEYGASADLLLVSARTADCTGLFAIARDTSGVSMSAYALRDGTPAADIELNAASAQMLLAPTDFVTAIDRAIALGMVATMAEALGVTARALEMTVDYTRTRVQFGAPIGDNQVLQHRMAEMQMRVELSRSAVMMALRALGQNPAQRAEALSQAKAVIGDYGTWVCQQAIQLHGGMGMVDAYPIGRFYKRMVRLDHLFGDSAHHLARLARKAA